MQGSAVVAACEIAFVRRVVPGVRVVRSDVGLTGLNRDGRNETHCLPACRRFRREARLGEPGTTRAPEAAHVGSRVGGAFEVADAHHLTGDVAVEPDPELDGHGIRIGRHSRDARGRPQRRDRGRGRARRQREGEGPPDQADERHRSYYGNDAFDELSVDQEAAWRHCVLLSVAFSEGRRAGWSCAAVPRSSAVRGVHLRSGTGLPLVPRALG